VLEDWQHQATNNPEVVCGWWAANPDYNVGVQLGPRSGIIDVECDSDEAERQLVLVLGEEEAFAAPRWLGKRGPHRLFADSPDLPCPDKACFHWRGIEFRTGHGDRGAQSLMPPSVHPDGPTYTWQRPPNGQPPAPLPAAAVAVIKSELAAGSGSAGLGLSGAESLGPGQRHPFLLRLAGFLRGQGLGPQAIYDHLADTNRRLCRPPKPDEEVRALAGWVGAKESGYGLNPPVLELPRRSAPRGPELPRPADFPVEALPPVLAEFVVQTAAAMGCPTPFVALPVLAAVFGCVGNTRRVLVKKRWSEPAVGWFVVLGESGTLKSPAQREALAPLRRVAARLSRERVQALKTFEWDREKYAKVRAEALKEGKEMPPAPERPPDTRVLVSDVTIERLAVLLADNLRGLLLARDELSGWVGSWTRYGSGRDYASSDLPHWLSIFNAEPILVDRKTGDRPSIHVPSAAVSVTGGIQPRIWRRIMGATHYDSGLVARLLVARPLDRKKDWTTAEASDRAVSDYEGLLNKLLAASMSSDDDGLAPFMVRLTPEAYAAWVQFYGGWAERQVNADDEPRAMLAKLEGYCARLALVHSVVTRVAAEQDDCDPIEADSVKAAITLTRWFAGEAERAYCQFAADELTWRRGRLIAFIRAQDSRMTPRALHRSNKSRYPTTAAAEAALNELAALGVGCWMTEVAGGRPSQVFYLAPEPPPDSDPNHQADN
jgi:hypothetical protein